MRLLCAFQLECLGLIERCDEAIGRGVSGHESLDRVLQVIQVRYREAGLGDISRDAPLSIWHVSRLLNQHTGCGFATYLNRLRASVAEGLLQHTALSIKKVAAAVEYGSTSQLDRHFKRSRHTTPVLFRRAVLLRNRGRSLA